MWQRSELGAGRRRPPRHRLIGWLTVVVLALIVVVSYRANQGLPGESRYTVAVAVPDAARIVHFAPVRVHGVRVGQVASVSAVARVADHQPFARIVLSLDPSLRPLPTDSRVQVRSISVLGATYIELTPGRDRSSVPDGGTLALRNAVDTVQTTDLLATFDTTTKRNFRAVVTGVGDGLAGRGADLNLTLATLAHLLAPATRIGVVLASRSADLPGFLRGYEQLAGQLAPVSRQLASMLAGARGTLDAVQAAGPGLGATFDEFPPTETATSDALVGLRPALISVASVMRRMQPGAQLLPTAIPAVDKLLATGSRTLPSLRPFAARLRVSLQSLTRLSRDPPTAGSVRKLTELAGALDVLLARMVPAQLSCNVLGVFGVQQPYMVTSLGGGEVPFLSNSVAAHAAQGEQLQNAQPSADMHSNPAPNENASECEAGNEPYKPTEQALSNPPGLQSRVVPHTLPPLEARQHTLQGTP